MCAAGGGAESAILRTWPDNDDSDLNDSVVDSEGNVHRPQAEREKEAGRRIESEAEEKE